MFRAVTITKVKCNASQRANFNMYDVDGAQDIKEETDKAMQGDHLVTTFNHTFAGTTIIIMKTSQNRARRVGPASQPVQSRPGPPRQAAAASRR